MHLLTFSYGDYSWSWPTHLVDTCTLQKEVQCPATISIHCSATTLGRYSLSILLLPNVPNCPKPNERTFPFSVPIRKTATATFSYLIIPSCVGHRMISSQFEDEVMSPPQKEFPCHRHLHVPIVQTTFVVSSLLYYLSPSTSEHLSLLYYINATSFRSTCYKPRVPSSTAHAGHFWEFFYHCGY